MGNDKTEQPDEALLIQDIMALRKHGWALVDSLEGLQGEHMVKHASPLFDLQWWEFVKTRIENWKRYIRALDRDGVSSPVRESGTPWQPIETAPKDGKPIWAWITSPKEKKYPINSWCLISWCKEQKAWVGHLELFGRFTGTPLKNIHGGIVPTHWMPLPQSPSTHVEGG